MGVIGEDLLKLNIKERKFSPFYLIYGDEGYTKKHYLELIKEKTVGKELADLNLHIIEDGATTLEEIGEMARGIPIMSDYTCIVVNDFDFSDADDKKLKALFEDINETSVVVFYMQTLRFTQTDDMCKKAYKLISKYGSVLKFDKKDSRDLARLAMSAAKSRGCFLPQYLAAEFVNRVGNDMNMVRNEVEKLCSYVSQGEITKADIEAVSVKTIDEKAFNLSKAITRNNPNEAFAVLADLYAQRTPSVMIFGAVVSSYVDMYRVKTAVEAGHTAMAVDNYYPYGKFDWKLKNAAYTAKRLSISQLRRSINVLCEADTLLKTTQNDDKTIIEETIVKLMLVAARDTQQKR